MPSTPREPSDELVERILAAHRRTGGATFNITTGDDLAGRSTYAVSVFRDRERRIADGLTRSCISEYIQANSDLLANPDLAFGIWTNGDHTVLDVVVVHSSLELAAQFGRLADQQMIADLSRIDQARGQQHTGTMIKCSS